jgi:hypothetical protein
MSDSGEKTIDEIESISKADNVRDLECIIDRLDLPNGGLPAKIAARLPAVPDVVLISEETYNLTKDHFTFDAGSPYEVELAGIANQHYWIVDSVVDDSTSRIGRSLGEKSTI